MPPSPRLRYTRREAAEILNFSLRTVDYMIARGDIKVLHAGRHVHIHLSEIERVSRRDMPNLWPAGFSSRRRVA